LIDADTAHELRSRGHDRDDQPGERHPHDTGQQADQRDRAHHHRDGLRRRHADGLEDAKVVHPLTQLPHHGVQHAETGPTRNKPTGSDGNLSTR
jgi:hypothetical protein